MNGCWDSAFFDPTYPCSNVCKDAWPCLGSTGGTSCAVHAYDFSGGERLSALAEACNATLDHLIACGISGQIACETAAVVESPDMIERYECFSRSRCGAEERCNVQPDASLAEEICDAVASSCRESRCTVDAKKHLTADLPWFRSDTVEAAKRCLSERSCRDMHDCLDAWKFTAYAGAPFFLLFE
jgi:hypothetical protein